MNAAGAELDRHLARSIKEFAVPEIGGKSLANDVRIGLAGLKKKLEALRLDAAAAVNELATEINNGEEGVKRIRSETAEVKAAFAEILGNEGGQAVNASGTPNHPDGSFDAFTDR